jgi:hypothetical protein
VGVQRHAPAAVPLGNKPGTHCTGGWLDPRDGLERAENLATTGTRYPDRTARSESLYRLSYLGPQSSITPGGKTSYI